LGLQCEDGTLEHIGHDLEDGGIGRCAAGGEDLFRCDFHPLRVQAHRHHLRFNDGAAIGGRFTRIEVETKNGRMVDARDDFGFEPRQNDRAVVAGRRGGEGVVELVPVKFVLIADAFAGERAVLETAESHVIARGRAKHIAVAALIHATAFHVAEECVTRAETDGHDAFMDEAEADKTAGVVTRPDERFGVWAEVVFLREIRTDIADDLRGRCERRKLLSQLRRGRIQRLRMPNFLWISIKFMPAPSP